MKRRLLNVLAGLSLLFFVATAAAWVWSRGGGAGPSVTWGQAVHTGYGFIPRNEVRYSDGRLYYTRARPPVVSLSTLGLRGRQAADGFVIFGVHGHAGYWQLVPTGDKTVYRRILWVAGWYPPALAAVIPSVWACLRLHERRRPRPGRCPACGYDLRATPARCPECGTVVVSTVAA